MRDEGTSVWEMERLIAFDFLLLLEMNLSALIEPAREIQRDRCGID